MALIANKTIANQDLTSLISGLQTEDPKLYQILQALNDRVSTVEDDLYPVIRQAADLALPEAIPVAPDIFTYEFTPLAVRLKWNSVEGVYQYEIRQGTDWDTALFTVRTPSLEADIPPLLVGQHIFLLKSRSNLTGVYSDNLAVCIVNVPTIGAISISARVIDNNALLNWNIPTSVFAISYYNFWRENALIGIVRGNFITYFEMVGGTFNYGISAVDVGTNESVRAVIPVTLAIPPDFVLMSIYVSQLGANVTQIDFIYVEMAGVVETLNYTYEILPGHVNDPAGFYFQFINITSTLVNCITIPGPRLLACWLITNWQQHFTNKSWLTPSDQMTAGYPIYIQPAAMTGSFEEIINYGAPFTNVIATISWSTLPISGTVSVVVKMAVSDDGVTYTPFVAGASQYFASVRFLKYRLEFTAADDHSLAEFYNVTVSLNVKQELDSGETTAIATDVGGTLVYFNKKFKDIDSITLTAEAKEPITAIYDFQDLPNPTHFSVYALDSAGNRFTCLVSWKARGVV